MVPIKLLPVCRVFRIHLQLVVQPNHPSQHATDSRYTTQRQHFGVMRLRSGNCLHFVHRQRAVAFALLRFQDEESRYCHSSRCATCECFISFVVYPIECDVSYRLKVCIRRKRCNRSLSFQLNVEDLLLAWFKYKVARVEKEPPDELSFDSVSNTCVESMIDLVASSTVLKPNADDFVRKIPAAAYLAFG